MSDSISITKVEWELSKSHLTLNTPEMIELKSEKVISKIGGNLVEW